MSKNNLKVVILAGGYGTRLGTLTKLKPKPMVDVCGKPILEHIMQLYLKSGFFNFIICAGYKNEVIKNYFKKKYQNDIVVDNKNEVLIKKRNLSIRIVNTGKNSLTGGRIKRIKKYVQEDEYFHMTYGDGLSNVNINKLTKYHIKNKKFATVTTVKIQVPQERFGVVYFKNKNIVKKFVEKPDIKEIFINGGFFVLSNKIFKFIKDDQTRWEAKPLEKIARVKQLAAFKHTGFWKCMDTLRDRKFLEQFKHKRFPWNLKN
ncbi:NTP transferase domain-containing protein [Pelagibacterales bacterium SAG-MED39]|nr:NTP transferase domain-containing protein [Pelagibacterales bacterium SAG-MED39]